MREKSNITNMTLYMCGPKAINRSLREDRPLPVLKLLLFLVRINRHALAKMQVRERRRERKVLKLIATDFSTFMI
jgi:hypothetical protein